MHEKSTGVPAPATVKPSDGWYINDKGKAVGLQASTDTWTSHGEAWYYDDTGKLWVEDATTGTWTNVTRRRPQGPQGTPGVTGP